MLRWRMLSINLIAIGIIGWLLWWWLIQPIPMSVAQAFIEALRQRDWVKVAGLAHPAEKQKLGLTEERIKGIGENLLFPIWKRLGEPSGLKRAENPFLPTPEEERMYFRHCHFFRVVRGGKEGALVLVTKTEEGWRVNFSLFAYTLLTEATEKGQLHRGWGLAALRQVGIYRLFVGSENIPLPPE